MDRQTANDMKRIGLFLRPLDVLFFRDGRPFTPGSHARGGLPQPQTLAGAITTTLLRQAGVEDFSAWAEAAMKNGGDLHAALEALHLDASLADVRVRGPWLAQERNDATPSVFLPAPVILVSEDDDEQGALLRFNPLPPGDLPPGWNLLEQERAPLWIRRRDIGKAVMGYVDLEGMRAFLRGEVPAKEQVCAAETFYGFDNRTGIGIDPATNSVEEGLIYSASMLAMRDNAGFYAEVDLPAGLADRQFLADGTVMHWGGEGRRVVLERVDPVDWPTGGNDGSGKSLYVLITPGRFADGWRPDAPPQGATLVSAAVPGHGAVSGWDLARGGPKPTRFTVPAGSVYFFDNDGTNGVDSFSRMSEDLRQGWGLVLKGVWNYA